MKTSDPSDNLEQGGWAMAKRWPRALAGKRWAIVAVKLAVVALVFWFVQDTIREGLAELGKHPLSIRPGWLLLSGILYLAGLLPAALFWRRILHTLGQDAKLLETLRAYYIGHLGKYVPGKAMVVVLRTGLVRSHRVDTAVAAVSVFFETLAMMSVGAFWAAGILAFQYREHGFLCLVSIGLMAAAGVPIIPPVFRRLARLAGVGQSDPSIASKIENLTWRSLFEGMAAMTVCWVMLGASLWAVLQAIQPEPLPLLAPFSLYVASVSLAVVAGFLSLIPGGAVVRELVLAQLIGRHFGSIAAVVGAVLLRLAWLLAELVISAILFFAAPARADIPRKES